MVYGAEGTHHIRLLRAHDLPKQRQPTCPKRQLCTPFAVMPVDRVPSGSAETCTSCTLSRSTSHMTAEAGRRRGSMLHEGVAARAPVGTRRRCGYTAAAFQRVTHPAQPETRSIATALLYAAGPEGAFVACGSSARDCLLLSSFKALTLTAVTLVVTNTIAAQAAKRLHSGGGWRHCQRCCMPRAPSSLQTTQRRKTHYIDSLYSAACRPILHYPQPLRHIGGLRLTSTTRTTARGHDHAPRTTLRIQPTSVYYHRSTDAHGRASGFSLSISISMFNSKLLAIPGADSP